MKMGRGDEEWQRGNTSRSVRVHRELGGCWRGHRNPSLARTSSPVPPRSPPGAPQMLLGSCFGMGGPKFLNSRLPLPVSFLSVSRSSVRLGDPLDSIVFPISDGHVWVALCWLRSLVFCNVFSEALQSGCRIPFKGSTFSSSPYFYI